MRRVLVVVAVVLVAVAGWLVARAVVGAAPEAEAPPVDPSLGAVRPGFDGDLVGRECLRGSWHEPSVRYPILDVQVAASGVVDACVEVHRQDDLDPSADYYEAAITAYWTTTGGWSLPMRVAVDAPAAGPTTLSLSSSEPHLSNVLLADATVLAPCTGEEVQPQPVGRGWVLDAWCYGDGALESREEGDTAAWAVGDQSGLDATLHTLAIKVAEGAEPVFAFALESPAEGRSEIEVAAAEG
ncbi:hypothetical protein QQX09_10360 [Demequina sp. SYSU T00192]|uniref:Uncharacterized protein n=1 Tax=Demequina litoralis TaxID=3051660 RepID=A0ABT8GBB1_9MICO|nr:hypothetical protein [Demequina sp. SYSU T00192]MDN4476257.1 hypothetical protein [Demequina sp. SYSU T00192]